MDKHSSLLQKFVNYGQKSFITFPLDRAKRAGETRAEDFEGLAEVRAPARPDHPHPDSEPELD
jgi:hypothetical protein